MSVMENAFNSNMDILQRWSDHSAGRMRAYHKILAFTEHEGRANDPAEQCKHNPSMIEIGGRRAWMISWRFRSWFA